MKKTYFKSIIRAVIQSLNRFLAIFLIVALGVGFFAGLMASAPDMRSTVTDYYNDTSMMDVRVLSTLGFSQNDIDAAKKIEGVEKLMPAYNTDVIAVYPSSESYVCRIQSIAQNDADAQNKTILLTGRMPQKAGECVVETIKVMMEEPALGDVITLSDENDDLSDALAVKEFTVVGTVRSSYYLTIESEQSNIGNGEVKSIIYTPNDSFAYDAYTALYIQASGARTLDAFSDEYDELVSDLSDRLKTLEKTRAPERRSKVVMDAQAELDDVKKEFESEKADAEKKLSDAQADIDDAHKKISDGEQELSDGRAELADAKRKLADGEDELQNKRSEYKKQIAAAEKKLDESQKKIDAAWKELEPQKKILDDSKTQLDTYKATLDAAKTQLDEQKTGLDAFRAQLDAKKTQLEEYDTTLRAAKARLESIKEELDKAKRYITDAEATIAELRAQGRTEEADALEAELAPIKKKYQSSLSEYNNNAAKYERELAEYNAALEVYAQKEEEYASMLALYKAALAKYQQQAAAYESQLAKYKAGLEKYQALTAQLKKSQKEIDNGRTELAQTKKTTEKAFAKAEKKLVTARADIADGEKKLSDGESDLADAKQELADGEAEYKEKKQEADEQIADAQKKLDDAQQKIDDIETPKWYVLDRNANAGYVSYSGNADKIAAIATIFPVFFFLVAALVTLTTMTRMVEDERGIIGTMSALGYSRGSIIYKYLLYAGVASGAGSIAGLLIGFRVFPTVIYNAYGIMYFLPDFEPQFLWSYASIGFAAAVAGTMTATWLACRSTMRETPASLILPRTPKAGKRIFLEYIRPLWSRMSFTQKVTARNILRYKKRFFMTVIGIAGCTALLLAGFGIRDSISNIIDSQFNEIYQYNMTVSIKDSDETDARTIAEDISSDSRIALSTLIMQKNMTAPYKNRTLDSTAIVPIDMYTIADFYDLHSRADDAAVIFDDTSVLVSEKYAELQGLSIGDTFELTDPDDNTASFIVGDIVKNYVGNNIFIPADIYIKSFSMEPDYNTLLAIVPDADESQRESIISDILNKEDVSAVSFTSAMSQTFRDMIKSLDFIVVVLVICAGLLAFIVLYNLTNINITERQRELATIKVLGFFDREVDWYVFRETTILSVIGSFFGLLLGVALHQFIIHTVEMDTIMFGRSIYFLSYVYSFALTMAFTAIVELIMHRKLKRINMVESLKSVE